MTSGPALKRTAPTDGKTGNGPSAAMACALRILTRRDHTEKELFAKLCQKGFGRKAIAETLARCKELGYLNDARTAEIMARQMVGKGYGAIRIQHTLSQKGVDERQIQRAMACCGDDHDQVQCAQQMLEKKRALAWRRETDPQKRLQKARRYLAGRGFPAEIVNQVIGAFRTLDTIDEGN